MRTRYLSGPGQASATTPTEDDAKARFFGLLTKLRDNNQRLIALENMVRESPATASGA